MNGISLRRRVGGSPGFRWPEPKLREPSLGCPGGPEAGLLEGRSEASFPSRTFASTELAFVDRHSQSTAPRSIRDPSPLQRASGARETLTS
jgi:hypothetical protein